MTVRDLEPSDFPAVQTMHEEMGLDFRFPDLSHPLFIVKKAAFDDSGKLCGVCVLRLTAETMLWLDPSETARGKMETITSLQPAILQAAWANGLDEIEARIFETVETRFQKRLNQLGWSKNRSGWHPWTISTETRQ